MAAVMFEKKIKLLESSLFRPNSREDNAKKKCRGRLQNVGIEKWLVVRFLSSHVGGEREEERRRTRRKRFKLTSKLREPWGGILWKREVLFTRKGVQIMIQPEKKGVRRTQSSFREPYRCQFQVRSLCSRRQDRGRQNPSVLAGFIGTDPVAYVRVSVAARRVRICSRLISDSAADADRAHLFFFQILAQ